MITEYYNPSIKKLKPYIPNNLSFVYKMDANESPFQLSESIMKRFQAALKKLNINQYPDSDCSKLRIALSSHLNIPYQNIIVGNGSDEMIKLIMDTFVVKSDVILSHSPTFVMYQITSTIHGARYLEVDTDNNFNLDISDLIFTANKEKAKLIFLCNPNNPTGQIISKESILRVIKETRSIVIVDEAYIEFSGTSSIVSEINNYDRLIVLRTLSKAFGLAGIRCGYMAANKKIIDLVNRVKPPYNLNQLSQALAIEVLNNYEEIKPNIELLNRERDKLYNEMTQLDGIIPYPSKANFILFKSKYEVLYERLLKKGILVRRFNSNSLHNFIRVSINSPEANKAFLTTLKEVVYSENNKRI